MAKEPGGGSLLGEEIALTFWGEGRVVAFLGVRPWNYFPFEEGGPVILSVDSQKKLKGG